jgi:biopolymer transport protein ExbD
VGVPMSQMKRFLDLPDDQRKAYKSTTGIPMDSTKKELVDWVQQSLTINPDYKLAIKGDVATKYPKVKALFEGLRDIKFYKFWLITSQEQAQ